MRKLLELLAFLLIAQGLGGVAHHFFDWFDLWALVHRVGFLDGHELYTSVVLFVLGVAVGGVAERLGP
ncbi:hypothetical protein V1L54_14985 [Streptomyces sp. TRM 70361]|uniref:hypothetical protein n=1 Tax=Streptomyces sp. TRM 70361 TaxID=3116553 RepID=UPI002E7B66DB|nr:hypothetical protein [Streptomyces sp. TRM 70361]MEE1940693.1 hypothetical protein [Streptomyces sp. TRM 70361]